MSVELINKKEFSANMEANKDKLHLLKLQYLAAQLIEEELKEKFKACYNKVLQDNIFTVSKVFDRDNDTVKIGDRITDDDNCFRMSEDDFNKYQKLCTIETHKAGLTTEDGTYTEGNNGMMIRLDAENALIDFQISLLPENIREEFKDVKKNYTLRHKFLDIIMSN